MRYTSKRKDLKPRQRRHRSIRNKIRGTKECPRLHVQMTLRYVYAQVIDDTTGTILASANSAGKSFALETRGNTVAASEVGKLVGEAALAAGLNKVVFDRAGSRYHGKVKALAEAAREAGLKF